MGLLEQRWDLLRHAGIVLLEKMVVALRFDCVLNAYSFRLWIAVTSAHA
jgi:hypothetical protein